MTELKFDFITPASKRVEDYIKKVIKEKLGDDVYRVKISFRISETKKILDNEISFVGEFTIRYSKENGEHGKITLQTPKNEWIKLPRDFPTSNLIPSWGESWGCPLEMGYVIYGICHVDDLKDYAFLLLKLREVIKNEQGKA